MFFVNLSMTGYYKKKKQSLHVSPHKEKKEIIIRKKNIEIKELLNVFKKLL